ncbi:MAG TPA: hypothetical protein VLA72_08785, partial [Anaerolineales bacterium]|nr:hypothetical protein [Anaerolineales bacterium]
GAIVEGAKSNNAVGQSVDSIRPFKPSGYGKIIITASESMQYAFDGKHVEGQIQNSLFTHQLIEGIQSGRADTDNDGLIDIDELYQFAYEHVTSQQTPNISSTSQEGKIYIGLNPNPKVQLAQLSNQLQQAMLSETRLHRQGAVSELSRLLKSADPSVALSAEMALQKMVRDDSKSVADFAQEALNQHFKAQATTTQRVSIQDKSAFSKSLSQSSAAVTPPPVSTVTNVHPNAPSSPANPPVSTKRNENTGGCLNVILPGIAHALIGNWKRAIITFIVTGILFTILGGVMVLDFGLCSGPIALGILVFLFFEGRKAFRKDNELKS